MKLVRNYRCISISHFSLGAHLEFFHYFDDLLHGTDGLLAVYLSALGVAAYFPCQLVHDAVGFHG